MNVAITSLVVFACVFGAAMFGILLRSLLPEHHLNSETKDTVKIAMGFVATMAALILGLLVASAKDSYDKQASGVTQMAAKAIFLDRLLEKYGPETKEVRAVYHRAVEQITQRMWPDDKVSEAQLDPSKSHNEDLLVAIESLRPTTELQNMLKPQAISVTLELGQMRWLEYAQANSSASRQLLYLLVFWISVLFASFGLFAPRNATAIAALKLSALSVAGAIYLILELGSPFHGFLQIPKTAFLDALAHIGK